MDGDDLYEPDVYKRQLVVFLHLPTAVVGLVGLLGGEHATQVFAEISGQPFLVVHLSLIHI